MRELNLLIILSLITVTLSMPLTVCAWELYDDFNYSGTPDPTKWNIGSNSASCGVALDNGELKFFCDEEGSPGKKANANLIYMPSTIYAVRFKVKAEGGSGDIRFKHDWTNGRTIEGTEHWGQLGFTPADGKIYYTLYYEYPEDTTLWYREYSLPQDRFLEPFTVEIYFFPNHVKYVVEGIADVCCSLESNYEEDDSFVRGFWIKSSNGDGAGVFYLDDVYVERTPQNELVQGCPSCSNIKSVPPAPILHLLLDE